MLNKYGTGIIEDKEGNKYHLLLGKLHSEDDNPTIEYTNGDQLWYKNGLLHRNDGPAAIIGDRFLYYLDGFSYSLYEYNKILRKKKKDEKIFNIINKIYVISLFIVFPTCVVSTFCDLFHVTTNLSVIPWAILISMVLFKSVFTNHKK